MNSSRNKTYVCTLLFILVFCCPVWAIRFEKLSKGILQHEIAASTTQSIASSNSYRIQQAKIEHNIRLTLYEQGYIHLNQKSDTLFFIDVYPDDCLYCASCEIWNGKSGVCYELRGNEYVLINIVDEYFYDQTICLNNYAVLDMVEKWDTVRMRENSHDVFGTAYMRIRRVIISHGKWSVDEIFTSSIWDKAAFYDEQTLTKRRKRYKQQ